MLQILFNNIKAVSEINITRILIKHLKKSRDRGN